MRPVTGRLFLFILFFLSFFRLNAQSPGSLPDTTAGGHRGKVKVLIPLEGDQVLSAGEDGFLGIWNTRTAEARERFQLSPHNITAMVLRPGKSQVSIAESDGLGFYRISAWDYREKKNLFSLRFEDPVSYINYSAGGTFLITVRNGSTRVVFINSDTGAVLASPPDLTGPVSLAATGRSERIMISYAPTGLLSYWDLESGEEIRRFSVPANLQSPLLFGGSRFLAGFDGQGLLILDTVSGTPLTRYEELRQGSLAQTGEDRPEFVCLSPEALYIFTISGMGTLSIRNLFPLPSSGAAFCSVAANPREALLGTTTGEVHLAPRNGDPVTIMRTSSQKQIEEIAASASTLALLSNLGEPGFIPLDFLLLKDGEPIRLGEPGNYTHVTASPIAGEGGTEPFLFWQTIPGRDYLLLRPFPVGEPRFLRISSRSALRSAAVFADQALLLDSAGTVMVASLKTGEPVFTFSTLEAMDAVFLDRNNFIIARGAVSGNSPFLMANSATGETVSLAYPAVIAVRIYQGRGGDLYGAVIEQRAGGISTAIIRLNTASPALSTRLVEYEEEDTYLDMAESGGALASTLGGNRAVIYGSSGTIPFERSPGLPKKLIDGGSFFIVLDGEGTIAWHESATGKLQALFRLYEDHWLLDMGRTTRQGPVMREE